MKACRIGLRDNAPLSIYSRSSSEVVTKTEDQGTHASRNGVAFIYYYKW